MLASSSQEHPLIIRPCTDLAEREAGIAYLSHIERLAKARFHSSEGIQGTKDLDFVKGDTKYASRSSGTLTRGNYDYTCSVKAKERKLYNENCMVLNHLIEVTKNSVPQVCRSTSEQKELFRRRSRQKKRGWINRVKYARSIQRANRMILRHLMDVKPCVRSTQSLNNWFHNIHKKRVKTLSRFKVAEPFAGARILQDECGVEIGNCYVQKSGALCQSPQKRQFLNHQNRISASRMPLLRGHPFPPLSMGELMHTIPRALLPPLTSTSYDGYFINHAPTSLGGAADAVRNSSDGRKTECDTEDFPERTMHNFSKPFPRRVRRPPWQSISASDIPILHHVQDTQLALTSFLRADCGHSQLTKLSQGPCKGRLRAVEQVKLVRDHEESACTQMWRRAVEGQYDQRQKNPQRCSSKNGALSGSSEKWRLTAVSERRASCAEQALQADSSPLELQKTPRNIDPTNSKLQCLKANSLIRIPNPPERVIVNRKSNLEGTPSLNTFPSSRCLEGLMNGSGEKHYYQFEGSNTRSTLNCRYHTGSNTKYDKRFLKTSVLTPRTSRSAGLHTEGKNYSEESIPYHSARVKGNLASAKVCSALLSEWSAASKRGANRPFVPL